MPPAARNRLGDGARFWQDVADGLWVVRDSSFLFPRVVFEIGSAEMRRRLGTPK